MRMLASWLFAISLLLTGCQTPETKVEPLVARFFLEARSGEEGVTVELPVSRARLAVGAKPVLVESDIVGVDVAQVELGRCLLFRFSSAAAADLARMSVMARGRRLVLTLNDRPAGARPLDQSIGDGRLLVFIEGEDSALPGLASRIQRTSSNEPRR